MLRWQSLDLHRRDVCVSGIANSKIFSIRIEEHHLCLCVRVLPNESPASYNRLGCNIVTKQQARAEVMNKSRHVCCSCFSMGSSVSDMFAASSLAVGTSHIHKCCSCVVWCVLCVVCCSSKTKNSTRPYLRPNIHKSLVVCVQCLCLCSCVFVVQRSRVFVFVFIYSFYVPPNPSEKDSRLASQVLYLVNQNTEWIHWMPSDTAVFGHDNLWKTIINNW